MQGVIELRGAKQVLNTGQEIYDVYNDTFIPGDIVIKNSTGYTLVKRQPQKLIGVVAELTEYTATLRVLNFGPTCHFRAKVPTRSYQIGNRLILGLKPDGTIDVINAYSDDPKYDVNVLLDIYRDADKRPIKESDSGKPLYTIDTVVDHTDLNTFTIDPSSSVDFDDALSVDVDNNTIYIHIVDMAKQKVTGEGEDRLRQECYSLYLSNEHTEHLLDSWDASHNLSLIVGYVRPTITVKVVLDSEGLVTSYDIYRSDIVVKNRYNYEQVALGLTLGWAPPELVYLAELDNKRNSQVKYHINLPSVRVLSDYETGQVQQVSIENTNDSAHSLVATAMILANLTVSKHLSEKGVVLPNRFHESLRGMQLGPEFKTTGNAHVDSFIMVKRYARACYAVDKKGHFGLGLTDYVHFTSPMRRYADVVVHRILAGIVYEDLEAEVAWINHRSTVVRSCQNIYLDWKKLRYLSSLPGLHTVWVTGVSKSGILWFMPSLSLNGFVHVTSIEPSQYWVFDGSSLNGNSVKISLGDKLQATVTNVSLISTEVSLKVQKIDSPNIVSITE
jgi:exoribonuclease R